jgi:hypothetical protein
LSYLDDMEEIIQFAETDDENTLIWLAVALHLDAGYPPLRRWQLIKRANGQIALRARGRNVPPYRHSMAELGPDANVDEVWRAVSGFAEVPVFLISPDQENERWRLLMRLKD